MNTLEKQETFDTNAFIPLCIAFSTPFIFDKKLFANLQKKIGR